MLRTLEATWRLEWQRALARGRLFRMNVIIPLLIVAPVAFGGAPVAHAAAVYAVLFALFGTFGAAIPALRDGESGLLRRLVLLPLDARGFVLGRAAAGGCIDALQLLPAVIIIGTAARASVPTVAWLWVVLAGSLILANLVGLVVAALARSVGEGALFGAVVTLLLLHASGVFRTPAPGSWAERIEWLAPYRPLHELLLAAHTRSGPDVATAGLWVLLGLGGLLVAGTAERLLRAIAGADGQA